MLDRIINLLRHRVVFLLLLAANALVSGVLIWILRDTVSGDHFTYLKLADGLRLGRYSLWYDLEPYPPDTFRTPGYPAFILLIRLATPDAPDVAAVRMVQVVLYVVAIGLALKLIDHYLPGCYLPKNLFLVLLLPNLQLTYYLPALLPEALMIFVVLLYLSLEIRLEGGRWYRLVALGLVMAVLYTIRPIFLCLPAFRLLAQLFLFREWRRLLAFNGVVLVVFGATITPYALWNRQHHGIFSPTPVEGPAPNVHLGFWQHRLPGHTTLHYWRHTYMGEEILPLVRAAHVPAYIAGYDREWAEINREAETYLTAADRLRIPQMRPDSALFPTYSSEYTLARRRIIQRHTLAHIQREPLYYLGTRLYTALRLWVTGVNMRQLRTPGIGRKLIAVYPTLVTFFSFILGLVFVTIQFLRRRLSPRELWPFLLVIGYCWLLHVPMSIQSRYTVPVHVPALILLAMALAAWIEARQSPADYQSHPLSAEPISKGSTDTGLKAVAAHSRRVVRTLHEPAGSDTVRTPF